MASPDLWNRETRSAAPKMLSSHQVPHATFSQLAGGMGKVSTSDSPIMGWLRPRWQVPSSVSPGVGLVQCHTKFTRVPRYRSPFAGFLLPEHWWGVGVGTESGIEQPSISLVSLSEPWHWNAFPSSLKAISLLSPQGGKVWAAPCVAWGGASFSIAGILPWRSIRYSSAPARVSE